MRIHLAVSIALTLLAGVTHAQSVARPARPQATLGADIKQLLFDWEPAAGATYYQMYVLYPGASRFVTLGERMPASTTHLTLPIAVHLAYWGGSRFVTVGNTIRLEHFVGTVYVLGACNSAGCTSSTLLNPQTLMPDTVGYVKASNTDAGDAFGRGVTLSNDGYTLAVSSEDASNATGINGNQADNSVPNSGAVYLFRRRGNAWQQEAYIKASVSQQGLGFGSDGVNSYRAVALSADGSMLAAAAIYENVSGVTAAGTVYIYRRFQNAWSLVQKLRSPTPMVYGWFGFSIDMSHDGHTIKVNSFKSAQDISNPDTHTHIFVKNGSRYELATTLDAFYAGDECKISRLDGLGQTLVFSCFGGPTGGRMVTLKGAGATWVHVDDLPMSAVRSHQPIALNVDATWMALRETDAPPNVVGLYRWNGAEWVRAAGFPAVPTTPLPSGSYGWGNDLALSNDGRLLAIADATATNAGDVPPFFEVPIGAVYVYLRGSTPGAWTLRNVVKAPNAESGDTFGGMISLSASGRTLAVGAGGEASNATGIDGDRTNNSARNAGAAYLY